MLSELGEIVFSVMVGYMGALEFFFIARHLYHWTMRHTQQPDFDSLTNLQEQIKKAIDVAGENEKFGNNAMADGVQYKDGFRVGGVGSDAKNEPLSVATKMKPVEEEIIGPKKIEKAMTAKGEYKDTGEPKGVLIEDVLDTGGSKSILKEDIRLKEDASSFTSTSLLQKGNNKGEDRNKVEDYQDKKIEDQIIPSKITDLTPVGQPPNSKSEDLTKLIAVLTEDLTEDQSKMIESIEISETKSSNDETSNIKDQSLKDHSAKIEDRIEKIEDLSERMTNQRDEINISDGNIARTEDQTESPEDQKHIEDKIEVSSDKPTTTLKTQIGQSDNELFSIKPKIKKSTSDESSIEPMSSQKSSFSTQHSSSIEVPISAAEPRFDELERAEPDGEDVPEEGLQYTEEYLRSLDGIKGRPLVRDDGTGRRRAFKKRRSSGSSTSSRESRASREEELKMFTSLEDQELETIRKGESEFSPIHYNTPADANLKVGKTHRRHKRSPGHEFIRPDSSGSLKIDEEEAVIDPWGEVKAANYKDTEFWKREKTLSIDEEADLSPSHQTADEGIHSATPTRNMPKTSSFEEASPGQHEEAINTLAQQRSKESDHAQDQTRSQVPTEPIKEKENVSSQGQPIKPNAELPSNAFAEPSDTLTSFDQPEDHSESSNSGGLRRSPRVDEMDHYEERWEKEEAEKLPKDGDQSLLEMDDEDSRDYKEEIPGSLELKDSDISFMEDKAPAKNPIIDIDYASDEEEISMGEEGWDDTHENTDMAGGLLEGISDFYDFNASINPSRSKSRSMSPQSSIKSKSQLLKKSSTGSKKSLSPTCSKSVSVELSQPHSSTSQNTKIGGARVELESTNKSLESFPSVSSSDCLEGLSDFYDFFRVLNKSTKGTNKCASFNTLQASKNEYPSLPIDGGTNKLFRTISNECRDNERIKTDLLESGFKRSTYAGESMDLTDQYETLREFTKLFRRSNSRSPSPSSKRHLQDHILDEITKTTLDYQDFSSEMNRDYKDYDRRSSDSALIQKPEILIQIQDYGKINENQEGEEDEYLNILEDEEYHHYRRFSLNQTIHLDDYPNDNYFIQEIEVRTLSGENVGTWVNDDVPTSDNFQTSSISHEHVEFSEDDEQNLAENNAANPEVLKHEDLISNNLVESKRSFSHEHNDYEELTENEDIRKQPATNDGDKVKNEEKLIECLDESNKTLSRLHEEDSIYEDLTDNNFILKDIKENNDICADNNKTDQYFTGNEAIRPEDQINESKEHDLLNQNDEDNISYENEEYLNGRQSKNHRRKIGVAEDLSTTKIDKNYKKRRSGVVCDKFENLVRFQGSQNLNEIPKEIEYLFEDKKHSRVDSLETYSNDFNSSDSKMYALKNASLETEDKRDILNGHGNIFLKTSEEMNENCEELIDNEKCFNDGSRFHLTNKDKIHYNEDCVDDNLKDKNKEYNNEECEDSNIYLTGEDYNDEIIDEDFHEEEDCEEENIIEDFTGDNSITKNFIKKEEIPKEVDFSKILQEEGRMDEDFDELIPDDDDEDIDSGSDDDRLTVVEVDDGIDEDISDFNERGEESYNEQSECEQAEREADRYAGTNATDWKQIELMEEDDDSVQIDQMYDDAIKNRKQSGILREFDSLAEEKDLIDYDPEFKGAEELLQEILGQEYKEYIRRPNSRASSKESTRSFIDNERRDNEHRYLGDANADAIYSTRLRSRYGITPSLSHLNFDENIEVDMNYVPKKQYNWRKNFKVEDEENVQQPCEVVNPENNVEDDNLLKSYEENRENISPSPERIIDIEPEEALKKKKTKKKSRKGSKSSLEDASDNVSRRSSLEDAAIEDGFKSPSVEKRRKSSIRSRSSRSLESLELSRKNSLNDQDEVVLDGEKVKKPKKIKKKRKSKLNLKETEAEPASPTETLEYKSTEIQNNTEEVSTFSKIVQGESGVFEDQGKRPKEKSRKLSRIDENSPKRHDNIISEKGPTTSQNGYVIGAAAIHENGEHESKSLDAIDCTNNDDLTHEHFDNIPIVAASKSKKPPALSQQESFDIVKDGGLYPLF